MSKTGEVIEKILKTIETQTEVISDMQKTIGVLTTRLNALSGDVDYLHENTSADLIKAVREVQEVMAKNNNEPIQFMFTRVIWMFKAVLHYELGEEILTVEGVVIATIGPLSEFTIVKDDVGNCTGIRNSAVRRIDFLSEINQAYTVEPEKIIEQVEFTKLMADTEFENDKKNFGKKDNNMPNFHSHFHHWGSSMILGFSEQAIIWCLIVHGIYQSIRVNIMRYEVDNIMSVMRRSAKWK